ncbi:hypothetical protein [Bacillus sp. T3]|uniref:hypothetical protein n=1 Tax=Bacillus sp. T3 TaxID=467262 RepID=UPI002981A893|nr:hypothetical protein [Bacillus sp. T3]
MTAKTMRSVAGGIFIAAFLMAIVYFLGGSDSGTAVKTVAAEKMTAAQMKKELSSDGFVIKTQEEWDAQVAAVKAAEKKAKTAAKNADTTDAKNKDQQEQKGTEKVVYRTALFVASGMTSIDVGNALVQSKIIPNALEFSQEVDRRGLANSLKPGMYEVESGMTTDEIMAAIFK